MVSPRSNSHSTVDQTLQEHPTANTNTIFFPFIIPINQASTRTMSEENQLFWKAYASTVKNIMVSGPVGDNTRVYIAAANTAGISGGKDIPAVCTNWGIYQYADFLLDPTNPNFVASKVSRYSEALNMTLQTLTPVSSSPPPTHFTLADGDCYRELVVITLPTPGTDSTRLRRGWLSSDPSWMTQRSRLCRTSRTTTTLTSPSHSLSGLH